MTDPFDPPGSISAIKWEDYEGRLVLITPLVAVENFLTSLGEGPIIRANVVVLDGPGAPEDYHNTIIFPKVLQGQIRANVGTGRSHLGRVGKGEKRPGQSAPWMLGEPTEADKNIARDYLRRRASQAAAPGAGPTVTSPAATSVTDTAPPF
jgi:hypothetical protein